MSLPNKKKEGNDVIVAIDVDNLLISSAQGGQEYMGYSLIAGFHKMFAWIRTFGKILCVHLYLPPSQSTNSSLWHYLWEHYKNEFLIETIYCPPKKPVRPKEKPDNVDDHLIDHTKKIINLFGDQVRYFCLASGDLDYSPLLWELRRKKGIEIAFSIGSESSFSKVYRQMQIVAKHPETGEELVYYFSPKKE